MKISSCLIGEDSLLIHCGNLLLTRKHNISLIISSSTVIKEWARKNEISCVADVSKIASQDPIQFDYIFSIANSHILPPSVLNLAKKHAINYHDSILPQYAGLNSTSWAIINNEKQHGITWHLMNAKVDQGDILIQEIFPIDPNDTALTLNLRCYEMGIKSFDKLLKAIETNSLNHQPQCLHNRSYYSSTHSLPYFGFIDWKNSSAENIERLSRALTLGDYENHIGTLKLCLNQDFLIVSHAEVTEKFDKMQNIPGTILAIEPEGLYVATLTKTIKLSYFLLKKGRVILIKNMAKKYDLYVGKVLPSLNSQDYLSIKEHHKAALKYERFWVNTIRNISEHHVFSSLTIKQNKKWEKLRPIISLNRLFPNKEISEITSFLLTAVLIYLYRINNHERVTISLVHPHFNTLFKASYGALFSMFLPFFFDQQTDFTLQEAINYVKQNLTEFNAHLYFYSDLTVRYQKSICNSMIPEVVINLNGQNQNYIAQEKTIFYVNLDSTLGQIEILHCIKLSAVRSELQELILNSTQHLINILTHLVNHPHLNARYINFLTQSEQYKLLSLWGKGKERYLPNQSIFNLFEEQVAKNPNKIAIYMDEKAISYAQLAFQVDIISSYLCSKKLTKQTLIGIYLERSIEMIAVILGILKTNCIYVPLDTRYPLLKIQQIVEDSNLYYLFIEDSFLAQFDNFFKPLKKNIKLFLIKDILSSKNSFSHLKFKNENISGELAYVMFTSGTTGRSKGVMVTQENIINYCKWFTETTQLNESGIIDFSSSIAFDLSIPCTIAPLLAGASISIASTAQKNNPYLYLAYLKKYKITHVELTPGYVELLLSYPKTIKKLKDLRFLLLGADIVPSNLVMKWLSLCPQHQVVNEYGPTETTVSVTSYFVNKESLEQEVSVPIGRPAFNSNCYVLDKYGNLCPAGMKGELCIGGKQVTKGYINREELTNEKYIRASFIDSNEVIYKTGDIVSWLPDGNLQFFGRNDHQVKIQGYRVEPQSIESILLKIPDIQKAVVVIMKGNLNERYLRAYLVSEKKIETSSEIINFLASYLPSYMIPREFCVIKNLPLKENEKIDFTALEKTNYNLLNFNTFLSSNSLTSTEQVIKQVWEKIFNSSMIDKQDDFFIMGGDSLMAMQMISELRTRYKKEFPLQLLFKYSTMEAFAKKIEEFLKEDVQVDKILSCVVKLSSGKNRIPLFLIHPVGGSIFWYKRLATYLENKYTVYGIQDMSLDSTRFGFNKLEDMAAYYLHEIKNIYSGDYYYLGGASFGATVAFEIANQLINSQKNVQFLGLFDGWAHYPSSIMKQNTIDLLNYNSKDLWNNKERKRLVELEQGRKQLLAHYELPKLKINATLFKSNELWPSFISIDNKQNGWGPYIQGNITTYKVPGNHESMFFEPNIQYLANILTSELDKKSKVLKPKTAPIT